MYAEELNTSTRVHVLSTMMLMIVATVTKAGLATTKWRLMNTITISDLKVSARVQESKSLSGEIRIKFSARNNAI